MCVCVVERKKKRVMVCVTKIAFFGAALASSASSVLAFQAIAPLRPHGALAMSQLRFELCNLSDFVINYGSLAMRKRYMNHAFMYAS